MKLDFETLVRESGIEGIADEIELIVPPPFQVGARFAEALDTLDVRRRTVALKRTYARNPEKLEALGNDFGVSRERARQLEVGLRSALEEQVGEMLREAAEWLRRTTGSAAEEEDFGRALEMLVGDAPKEVRTGAEVALMEAAGYQRLEWGVGDREFLDLVYKVRSMAPGCANDAGIVDEEELREAAAKDPVPAWDLAVRNAGLVRVGDYLMLRDTRARAGVRDVGDSGQARHETRAGGGRGPVGQHDAVEPAVVGSSLRAPHEGQVGAGGLDRQPLRRRGH